MLFVGGRDPSPLLATRYGSVYWTFKADPGFFFRRGCPTTSTPINHIVFFFLQNTSCIRKPQVISGRGGGGAPLHPSPRSAPDTGRERDTSKYRAQNPQFSPPFLKKFKFYLFVPRNQNISRVNLSLAYTSND